MTRALIVAALAALVGCGSDAGAGDVAQSTGCGASPSLATGSKAGPALPRLTGRIVDDADLLVPAAEAAVERELAALETKTRDQLVVVTTPDLHGESIEDFALRLGNDWGVGRRELDNGVLLIVAPNERKTRIEVGCGLEGLLTDAEAKKIVETSLVPRFRRANFQDGITSGVGAIIRVLESDSKRPQAAPARKDA